MLMITVISTPEFTIDSNAAGKNVVVVIDPGHGGEGEGNTGAIYNGYTEKDITLRLANALVNELSQYENVTVYQTRTTDTKMTLEERAGFAKSVNADFVFSIHFNASLEHHFYGSEVWTSAFGRFFQSGFDFGQVVSKEWNALGLYQKGVKTKLGKKGRDYYGIIRQSVSRNMPCVILEHAYLDHNYDVNMLNTNQFIERLAHADATAMAKYFKLKSPALGTDYTGFSYTSIGKPADTVHQDTSTPDTCNIKALAYDLTSGNVLVEMTAKDAESPVIYFSYSYDGGENFCILQMWDRTKDTQTFNVKVPSGTKNPVIVCRCYNNYELWTQSEPVALNAEFNY
jgi:N-acetylmuramoyl-L-alanine amidase